MISRRLGSILLALVLVTGMVTAYFWGTPRLVQFSPLANAGAVPAKTPLRLVFSRPMQAASVTERLTIYPPQTGAFDWEGQTLVFTPDQPWPSGATIEVHLAPGARAAGLLPLQLVDETSWSFIVRQPRLVYLFPADQLSNIYALDINTGESQQLTDSSNGIAEFDMDTDGTRIYYSAKNATGGSDIFRLMVPQGDEDVDATQEREASPEIIVECPKALCRAPQISPDGDFLAYERSALAGSGEPAFPQVWLLSLPGEEVTNPVSAVASDPDRQTMQPDWSPEGLLTFYDSTLSAFIILDPHTGESTRFPNQTGQAGSWNPNGRDYVAPEISFVELVGSPQLGEPGTIANSHLIRFNRENGKTQDLTLAHNLEDTAPVFSPDGRYLALARKFLDNTRWTPGRQLWLMRSDGSEAHPLTNDPYFNHYDFAWSPDGDQLAYVRFNQTTLTEPPEIWLIDTLSTRATRLVVGGYAPQWIP